MSLCAMGLDKASAQKLSFVAPRQPLLPPFLKYSTKAYLFILWVSLYNLNPTSTKLAAHPTHYNNNLLVMATFHIQTERPAYLPGETVSGRLLLHVPAKITNTQGLILRFSALECLKSLQQLETSPPAPSSHQIQSNHALKNQSYTPEQVYHVDNLQISECHSESVHNQSLRPKYIKNSSDKYYQLSYFQKRNEFAQATVQLMPAGILLAGQYCFPFSLQTYQNWPASYKQDKANLRAYIQYHITATLLPLSSRFHFTHTKDIIINDPISALTLHTFKEVIASFYCIKKGSTDCSISMDRQGYQSGDTAQIMIAIDNSQCQTAVQSAILTLRHTLTLRNPDNPITSTTVIHQKSVLCPVNAGESAVGPKMFKQAIKLPILTPSTKGQLISSEYLLQVRLKHDALFFTNQIHAVPFVVYAPINKQEIPNYMQKQWKPKLMPSCKLIPNNGFKAVDQSQMQQTLK